MQRKISLLLIIFIFFILILGVIPCFNINYVHAYQKNVGSGNSIQDQEVIEFVNEDAKLTPGVILVGFIVLTILIIFIWEPISPGIMALTIPFILVALDNWTGVTTEEALSGFSSQATITVMAMFVLSKGMQNSGFVQLLGNKIEKITGKNQKKQVGVISGISGSIAGFVNNTPVVATFIPMITELARKTKVSPSKLLIPLSYASMMGGTITLLGTSTNLLASQVSERLIGHPFAMFEFTKLGIIVLSVGILYLITIGYYLIPDRITYEKDLVREYRMGEYLTEAVVKENSPLVGKSVGESLKKIDEDIDVVQIIREGERFMEPLQAKSLQAGDHLILRTDQDTLLKVVEAQDIRLLPEIEVTQKLLEKSEKGQNLVEVVIPDNSFLEGRTLSSVNFVERYDATILAVRHGRELTHQHIKDMELKAGDVLLMLVSEKTQERLEANNNFIIEREVERDIYEPIKILKSSFIVGGVVILASFNIMPIPVAALGGVVVMVSAGCLTPQEAYKSINWDVYFLLSGLIPLGVAVEKSGTAGFLAGKIINIAGVFPPIYIMVLMFLVTAVITNIISPNASVVLMIPIAVVTAQQIGVNPFSFVLTVTFAASTAFSSPMGYQTNLMIYGPGGYKFKDFVVAGVPLQLIMSIIVPYFISIFWGL